MPMRVCSAAEGGHGVQPQGIQSLKLPKFE